MRPFFTLLIALGISLPVVGEESDSERAERRRAALENIELRIKPDGWGNASAKDLSAVLHSCCGELAVHFASDQLQALEPIRIRYDEAGPITKFSRTLRGEILVLLDSKNRFWCQHAYQMAHELGHILCRTRKGDRSNLWFEESLCELASIFALRQMATSWKTAPPFPNWKDYSVEFSKYSDDLIEKHSLPEDVSLRAFYQTHAEALSTKATDRALNGKVAVRLLPLFENAPQNWRAVYYLNAGPGDEKQTFEAYLRNWQQNCPTERQAFVAQVIEAFGLSL